MASDLSNAAQMAGVVAESASSTTLVSAMSTATEAAMATQEPHGWLGFFGWLILLLLNLISTILLWVIRTAGINIPSILFTLFSTSWTVTMNATTLYVCLHHLRCPRAYQI